MKPKFTPRERSVLDALIAGTGTTADIADRLDMAEGTVRTHLANVRRTTGHLTKTELALWWAGQNERGTVG